jgi:hypothetical protein
MHIFYMQNSDSQHTIFLYSYSISSATDEQYKYAKHIGNCPEEKAEILKIPILSGLHHHNFRKAA